MFASFYELFYYLFGVEIHVLKIIKTFGFLMACAFLVGGFVAVREFKNLKNKGYLTPVDETVLRGGGLSVGEWISNAIMGGIFGYKLSLIALNFEDFSTRDPELYLLSGDGYWWGAILGAITICGLSYWGSMKEDKEIARFIAEGKNPFPGSDFKAENYEKGKKVAVTKPMWPHERIPEIITIAAVSGVFGAKLFSWFEDWDSFLSDPLGHLLSLSGLTFYGGLICASLALIIYSLSKKINLLRVMDVGGMAVMLGYGVGRLGCHFSGDGDWGDPNPYTRPDWLAWLPDWAWAFTYPGNVAKVGVRMQDCISEYCFVLPKGVYPTPVWEFTMAVIIFLILLSLRNRFIQYPGILFAIYLMFNGAERFAIEMIRINTDYQIFGLNLSFSQFIAIGISTIGVLMAIGLSVYYKKRSTQNA